MTIADEVNENIKATHEVIAQDVQSRGPSFQAKVAFWVSIVNSGGLMILGAYCLKNAVDHLFAMGAVSVAVVAMAAPLLVVSR